MKQKKVVQDNIHAGINETAHSTFESFCFGDMSKVPTFKGTHPRVMQQRIEHMHWADELHYNPVKLNRPKMKHEKFKYRLITAIEKYLFGGRQLFGYKNWKNLGKFKSK
jgi:hypothetical protein